MRKTAITTLALLAATTAPVFAQNAEHDATASDNATKGFSDSYPDFHQADTNRDGTIDNNEMDTVASPTFNRWDEDGNDRLSGEEFAQGLHDRWANDNGTVDQTAYTRNWGNWFTTEAPGFNDADGNSDGQLSAQELQAALGDANFKGRWKGADDGSLTPEEFRNGLTHVNDRDFDGTLNENEFGHVITIVGVTVPADEQTAANSRSSSDGNRQDQRVTNTAANDMGTGVNTGEIIPLTDWNTDTLYQNGWSAESFFGTEVVSESGEEIGDVEDLLVSSDGKLLSVVAEVGGFWDIGDTHVSVPWDQVAIRNDGTVQIPVTEDNVDQFGFFNRPSPSQLENSVVSGLDDEALGPRAWRASELIGDLVRTRAGDMTAGQNGSSQATNSQPRERTGNNDGQMATARRVNSYGYGYVDDLIFQDGEIAATVVSIDAAYGTGARAYPFYGYGYGWNPGSRYYNLPYTSDEASETAPFDADRLDNRS